MPLLLLAKSERELTFLDEATERRKRLTTNITDDADGGRPREGAESTKESGATASRPADVVETVWVAGVVGIGEISPAVD